MPIEGTRTQPYNWFMMIISIILVMTGGVALAFQSPINTNLSKYVGNLQASTISFGVGTILLFFAAIIFGQGDLAKAITLTPWQFTGGLFGAFGVLMVTYAAPILGITLTLTMIMFGQLVMGALVDYIGIFSIEPIPVNSLRILGCLLVGIGIIMIYIGKTKQSTYKIYTSLKTVFISVIVFLSGVGCSIQIPINLTVANKIGSMEATCLSFFCSFMSLLICTLIINKGKLTALKGTGVKPWMLTGGTLGPLVGFFNLISTPYIGVILVSSAGMLGQLSGAVLIDNYGLVRVEKIRMNPYRYVGLVVILAGIISVYVGKMMT